MGNSVIYRPAYDAEVEYLESDGNSYIDTGLKASSELGILAHIQNSKDNRSFPFGGADGIQNKEYGFQMSNGTYSSFRFGNGGTGNILPKLDSTTIYEFNNIDSHNIINVNDIVYQTTFNSFTSNYNFHLFRENRGDVSQGSNNGVRIYDFKIYQNSTLVRDFIPVRIGQVGYLYDKVTKQLFANKGTGNFILGNDVSNAVIPQQRCVLYFGNQRGVVFERIYEEYEWLISNSEGNVTPNIDTAIIPDVNQEISFTFRIIDSVTNGSEAGVLSATNSSEWGQRVVRCYKNKSYNHIILEYNNNYIDYPNHTDMCIFDDLVIGNEYNCSLTIDSATSAVGVINDTSKNLVPNGRVKLGSGSSYEIFRQNHTSSWSFKSVGFSKFRITGVIDLIPCKLLQSIPAILDGNGIARQAGECGMWDKVSNKFYGNVANSGTFTVKGPKCYEEYDTLLMDNGGATIPSRGSYFRLSNDISLTNKVFTINLGDTYRDLIIFGDTVNGSIYMIVIYTYSSGSITIQERYGKNNIIGTITAYNSKIVILDFQNNVATVGTQQFNIQGTGYKFSGDAPNYWSGIKYLKNITVDNELNLIPCKLTHGIPASMDANGIARPAGTCGMWDKVNDKFYGNVASSGTFTVSND